MGLDQYAYVAARAGQMDEYYDQMREPEDARTVSEPQEIAYWRKHPNLQGWMERLWEEKGRPGQAPESPFGTADVMFNGVELELTREDIDRLERDVLEQCLPPTQGFFFGSGSDDHYQKQDLEFCCQARTNLFLGLKVFYNSSW